MLVITSLDSSIPTCTVSAEVVGLLPLPIFTVRKMDCKTSVSSPGTSELARASAEVVDGVVVTTVLVVVNTADDDDDDDDDDEDDGCGVTTTGVVAVTGLTCAIIGSGSEDG